MAAFIIICILLVLSLVCSEALYVYSDMKGYAADIWEETIFYLKENPGITCIIQSVQRTGWNTPELTLEVTYPDFTVDTVYINMNDFQNLWMKIQ